MRHEYDRFNFPDLGTIVTPGRAGSQLSRYAGLPPSVEFWDRYLVQTWELGRTADQEAFVDIPASPTETVSGTEWEQTQVGGSTMTIVDTGFPPYLQIQTGATDTNGQQMQAVIGATGTTRTMFDTSTMQDMFFSVTCRFVDANNDNETIKQTAFFLGFAPRDVSILAGVDDYIGFTKADGSTLLKISADQTSGVPTTGASTTAQVIDMGTSSANLVNKWITLSFLVKGAKRTEQEGTVYAFVDSHRKPTGAVKFSGTHFATLNLDTNSDCPGAAMAPSIAFSTGEAVAKKLQIAKIVCAGAYRLG